MLAFISKIRKMSSVGVGPMRLMAYRIMYKKQVTTFGGVLFMA